MGDRRFEVYLCDTDESRSVHFQIRYQVYCMETGFEDPEEFFDKKEIDKHDMNSVHFAARDPANGHWIAAMRLVLAGQGTMPSEKLCNLDPIPAELSERLGRVEFSRLCVLESHRRHNRDRSQVKIIDGSSGRVSKTVPNPRYPEILLGFIRAVFAWSRENNVSHCYFLINRALARTLKRLNLELVPVGESCEHRGLRTPYLVDLRLSEQRMLEKYSVFKELHQQGAPYACYSDISDTLPKEAVSVR